MNIPILKRKMIDSFLEGAVKTTPIDEKKEFYSKAGNIWDYSVLNDKLTINLRVFSDYFCPYHIRESLLELLKDGQFISSVPLTTEETLEIRRSIIYTEEHSRTSTHNDSLAIKLLDEYLNPPKH